jgi:subtilisin-like proprotein convertase family protein
MSNKLPRLAVFCLCVLYIWPKILMGYSNSCPQSSVCTPPINITLLENNGTNIKISWTSSNTPIEQDWQIEIVEVGKPRTFTPTISGITQNQVVISNLKPATRYRIWIRALCGSGNSNWSSPFSVTSAILNGCKLSIPITDNSCNTTNSFPILVTTNQGNSLGINVLLKEIRVIVQHNWISDLTLSLISPSGKKVLLSNQNGGSADDYGNSGDTTCTKYCSFVSSDFACSQTTILRAATPFIGEFLPEGDISQFSDGTTPNGLWILEVCDNVAGDLGVLKGVELVFSSFNCAKPTGLYTTSIGSTQVAIHWNTSACKNTEIQVKNIGSSSSTFQWSNCPRNFPVSINGLIPFSEYEISLKETCANGQLSIPSCPIKLSTTCVGNGVSNSENWEMSTVCTPPVCSQLCPSGNVFFQNPANEAFWVIHQGVSPSSDTGPQNDVSGNGKYALLRTQGCNSGAKSILESGCFTIPSNLTGDCHMTFFYHMLGSTMGSLGLEVTENNGISWQQVWIRSGNQGNIWNRTSINLINYAGKSLRFRFVGTVGNGQKGDIGLDEINWLGPVFQGVPTIKFYQDLDRDNYGNDDFILSCTSNPPTGYSLLTGDCQDNSANINPGANEIYCNNVDENCNGIQDDRILNSPQVRDTSICKGLNFTYRIPRNPNGLYYWYRDSLSNQIQAVGPNFDFGVISNLQSIWVMDSTSLGCKSPRKRIIVNPLESPNLIFTSSPLACDGFSFDLKRFGVIDGFNTPSIINYFQEISPGNKVLLPNPIILALPNLKFFARAILPNTGCINEIQLPFSVVTPSKVTINAIPQTEFCINSNILLTTSLTNSVNPIKYKWQDNSVGSFLSKKLINSGINSFLVQIEDGNGCLSQAQYTANVVNGISSVRMDSIRNINQCGSQDGSIFLTTNSGNPPFLYNWSGPSNGNGISNAPNFSISNLSQGVYSLTIEDQIFPVCKVIIPYLVVDAPNFSVSIDSIVPVKCFGESNGGIYLKTQGSNPNYFWSNGSNQKNQTRLQVGVYSVTIVDGNCVNILSDLEVKQSSAPLTVLIENIQPPKCISTQGFIKLKVSGGKFPYKFLWSDGSQNGSIITSNAGIFSCRVSDEYNCQLVTVPISLPDLRITNQKKVTSITCNGLKDGKVELTILGGVAPLKVNWSNGQSGFTANNISPGKLKWFVEDNGGCSFQDSVELIEPQILNLSASLEKISLCEGLNQGVARAVPIGGSGSNYQITWNDGKLGSFRDSLPSGRYQAKVVDGNNCTKFSQWLDHFPPQFLTPIVVSNNGVKCNGDTTGSLDISTSGGLNPYSYNWKDGPTVQNRTSLKAGYYSVNIKDSRGCANKLDSLFVGESPKLESKNPIKENVSCEGRKDGNIFSNIIGGSPPYLYTWTNGSLEPNLLGVPSGIYKVSVQDVLGCNFESQEFSITDTNTLILKTKISPIKCIGNPFGSVSLSIQGGVPPLSYLWSNGATTRDASALSKGVYSVTVTDALGCTSEEKNLEIKNSSSNFKIKDQFEIPIQCFNSRNGCVSIEAENGTLPYTFSWSNGEINTKNISQDSICNLGVGDYKVTITDNGGCTTSSTISKIEQPPPIFIELDSIRHPVCGLPNNGVIWITPSGGNPPYTYLWSNSNTSETLANVGAGVYNLVLKDKLGCIAISKTYTINQALNNLSSLVVSKKDNLCFGDRKGEIELVALNGKSPYFYQWSNGSFGAKIQNLASGKYNCTIIDAVGCKIIVDSILISQPTGQNLVLFTDFIEEPKCFELNTGQIKVDYSGGVEPVNLFWSNNRVGKLVTGLRGGIVYKVTAIDANNCTTFKDYFLSRPDSLFLTANVSPPSSGMNNGSIMATANGGTPGYKYLWGSNAGNQTSANIFNLSPGVYCVSVEDLNGCKINSCYNLWLNSILENDENTLMFDIYPNPFRSFVQVKSLGIHPYKSEIVIRDILGSIRKKIEFNSEILIELDDLESGVFSFEIRKAEQPFEVMRRGILSKISTQ